MCPSFSFHCLLIAGLGSLSISLRAAEVQLETDALRLSWAQTSSGWRLSEALARTGAGDLPIGTPSGGRVTVALPPAGFSLLTFDYTK